MTLKLNLDIENYKYDMGRCMRCGGCKWVDHIYMSGVTFGMKCPSIARYQFDSYACYGKMLTCRALLEGNLEYSPELVRSLYACQLCGACDAGCKRNMDLEPQMVLETVRAKMVADGQGPMPEQKKIAENINKSHNRYGSPHDNRLKWLPKDVKPAAKADLVYFVGCSTSYTHPEIAQATAGILSAAGSKFMVLGSDEWCCGYPLYSTGQIEAFRKQVEHNIGVVKASGASTVLVSCAEGYKTWKVDYPKVLGKSTADMGYQVIHITEYVNELIKKGALNLKNKVDLKVTYHDPCNLARLSEPWIYWEGERGKWGILNPPREYRRGTNGVYQPPRDILNSIPGVELVEMQRIKENAWCCGAGGGVKDAFKDFALWTAEQRLEEAKVTGAEAIVSCCPQCKGNFTDAVNATNGKIKVYDITELILKAIA